MTIRRRRQRTSCSRISKPPRRSKRWAGLPLGTLSAKDRHRERCRLSSPSVAILETASSTPSSTETHRRAPSPRRRSPSLASISTSWSVAADISMIPQPATERIRPGIWSFLVPISKVPTARRTREPGAGQRKGFLWGSSRPRATRAIRGSWALSTCRASSAVTPRWGH